MQREEFDHNELNDEGAGSAPLPSGPDGEQSRLSLDEYRQVVRGKIHKRRQRAKRRAVLSVFGWIMLFMLSTGITLGALWWFSPVTNPVTGERERRGKKIENILGSLRNPEKSLTAAFSGQRELTVLLVGLDHIPPTRRDPGALRRSDSVILARTNFDTQQVRMASVPRDGWVEHWQDGQSHGHSNIANTYSYGQQEAMRTYDVEADSEEAHAGGVARLSESLEHLLGFHPDYYVVIQFDGLVALVDTLCPNGLLVDVDRRMKYRDRAGGLNIDLQKGPQLLNGEQVMGYARFRKERLGDYARMPRQQQVIKLLLAEMKKPENVTKLPAILQIVQQNVKTNLSADQLLALAQHLDDTFPEAGMQSITMKSVWNREPGHEFSLPGGGGMQGQAFFPEHIEEVQHFLSDLSIPPPPVPEGETTEGEDGGEGGESDKEDTSSIQAEGQRSRAAN